MSLVINNNLMAANTARNLNTHYGCLATSTQRLSSGLRINGAADDAAGLAIRELMRADVAALNQGVRNANDAISMIQVVDGALGVIDEKLIRMKELAEQAATGTYDSTQRLMIDSEFQAMASEINRIANATDFNGVKLIEETHISPIEFGNPIMEIVNINETTTNKFAAHNYTVQLNDGTSRNFSACIVDEKIDTTIRGNKIIEYYLNGDDIIKKTTNDLNVIKNITTNVEYFQNMYAYCNGIQPIHANQDLQEVVRFLNPDCLELIVAHPGTTSDEKYYNNIINRDYSFLDSNSLTDLIQSGFNNIVDKPYRYKYLLDFNGDGKGDLEYNFFSKNALSNNVADSLHINYINWLPLHPSVNNSINEHNSDIIYEKVGSTRKESSIKIHFGPMNDSAEDYYYIDKRDCTLKGLGLEDTRIETQDNAQKALVTINDAIVKKDKARAYYGAMQNRLENTVSNLTIQAENLQASESRISDVDVATEMTNFVRNQILTQSAVAMLSQANSMPQMAMQLIRG